MAVVVSQGENSRRMQELGSPLSTIDVGMIMSDCRVRWEVKRLAITAKEDAWMKCKVGLMMMYQRLNLFRGQRCSQEFVFVASVASAG